MVAALHSGCFSTSISNKLILKKNRQGRKPNRGMVKSGNNPSLYFQDPIPRLIPNEIKYVDSTFTTAPSAAGTWNVFTLPAQGSTAVTRVGDRARIQHLEIGYHFALSAAGLSDSLRWIILQEKGLSGATPTTTGVLAQANPVSPYTYNARELYEVLHDELFHMAISGDTAIVNGRIIVKPRIQELRFQSASTTVYSGQLYMLLLCYNNTNITESTISRIWFEDGN